MVHGTATSLLAPPALNLSNALPGKGSFDIPSQAPLSWKQTVDFPSSKFDVPYGSKYPDLFISPASQSMALEGSVAVFPVDTVIPQLSPDTSQKQELSEPSAFPAIASKSTPEMDNMLGMDADLAAIFLTPPNKEKTEDSLLDLAIPSDVSSLLDLFSAPDCYDSSATEIPTAELWEAPVKEDIPKLDSDVSISPMPDPLFTDISPGSLPLFNDVTYDSPPGSLQSFPGAETSSLGEQLQELLQRTTIDFTNSEDMLPPPSKRTHSDSNSLSPSLTPQPSPPHYDIKHEAPSPVSYTPSPISSTRTPSPVPSPPERKSPPLSPTHSASEGGKSRGPLLFGKHEDEIIHKLLALQPVVASRPVTRDKLVAMPVEEFNLLLEQAQLSEIEVAFMKEWRRRGKNKTAAQVARKRKREELSDLDVEVSKLRQQRAELQSKFDRLRSEVAALRERSMAAEDRVFQRYRTQRGAAVSKDSHSLHVAEDGRVMLVPRISSQVLLVK